MNATRISRRRLFLRRRRIDFTRTFSFSSSEAFSDVKREREEKERKFFLLEEERRKERGKKKKSTHLIK